MGDKMTKERAVTLSLPIFRKVQDLCSLMIDVQRDMQKQYKHSVGERMLDESLSLMKSIFAINRAEKTSSERLTLMDGFGAVHRMNGQISAENAEKFMQTMNSYFGFMKHYRSYRIKKRLLALVGRGWWEFVRYNKNRGIISVRR